MKSPIKRIESLIPSLPEKDIKYGNEFLKNRDFESLQLLIDSAIYRVKKSLDSENPKEEYLKVNMEDLRTLQVEVDYYARLLGIPNNDEFIDSELEWE